MTDESIGLAFDQEHLRSMQKLEEDVRPIIQEMTAVEVMGCEGSIHMYLGKATPIVFDSITDRSLRFFFAYFYMTHLYSFEMRCAC